MGIPKFIIVLDNPSGSFEVGSEVTGKVFLTLYKKQIFRGIKINFEGKGQVAWSREVTRRKGNINVHYSAQEEYFSNSYYLIGSENNKMNIPAGDHVYPFSTTLPPQLPTSFEGKHCYIRYEVTATLDCPWKLNYQVKTVFKVVSSLDLNNHALAKEPVKKEEDKTFCCFCCKSGPLTLVACVPQTGYVAGQDIPVTIEVDNASNVKVECIQLKICEIIKLKAHDPKLATKTDYLELSKMTLEGVEVNGSKSLTQSIKIPKMPFVNLNACSIIKISFSLKVTACVKGCHQDLSTEIPLIIGTVPIGQHVVPPPIGITPIGITVGGIDPFGYPAGPQISSTGMIGGAYTPVPGLNPEVVGVPVTAGTLAAPYPTASGGYPASTVQPGQYGVPGGVFPQEMNPRPDNYGPSIGKIPQFMPPAFNTIASAPPHPDSAPLMGGGYH